MLTCRRLGMGRQYSNVSSKLVMAEGKCQVCLSRVSADRFASRDAPRWGVRPTPQRPELAASAFFVILVVLAHILIPTIPMCWRYRLGAKMDVKHEFSEGFRPIYAVTRKIGMARRDVTEALSKDVLVDTSPDQARRFGVSGKMLKPSRATIAAAVSRVPQGTVMPITELRQKLANEHGAKTTCPFLTKPGADSDRGRRERHNAVSGASFARTAR